MPERSTLSRLDDCWIEQWYRADEICRLLEQLVPRREQPPARPSLTLVRDEDDGDARDPA